VKLYYFRGRGPRPNFGDHLNVWMWPQLLPDFFDDDDRSLFLGIGSILYDFLPPASQKVVFGAGYGGYTPLPVIDERWKFYFVRGRLTAQQLGLDASLAIGDAAILVRSCAVPRAPKTHQVSFIPHWESARDGEWRDISRAAGVNYIDPCAEIESVMKDIISSELVVAEAMHGAIVADALRVPWVPIRPLRVTHRSKWLDWASALNLDLRFTSISPSNALEFGLSVVGRNQRGARRLRQRADAWRAVWPSAFRERATRSLIAAIKGPAHMSSDAAIERAHAQMIERLETLRRDHGRNVQVGGARG
jgi:Polysaccharide pyruvyl transferase